jgi:hypothetical protein
MRKAETTKLKWKFSKCSDCSLRISKLKGGDCELQLIEVRKFDLEIAFDILRRRWGMSCW